MLREVLGESTEPLRIGNREFHTGALETLKLAEERLISWIGWEYKPFYPITGAGYGMFNKDGTVC